ncbi:hypothetical protein GQ54DRAFT_116305 [Martensiomyces pterosporus]|nr:hypothetical protein GQ54DRAFT_116305 [Martensiomyces pterosporus]
MQVNSVLLLDTGCHVHQLPADAVPMPNESAAEGADALAARAGIKEEWFESAFIEARLLSLGKLVCLFCLYLCLFSCAISRTIHQAQSHCLCSQLLLAMALKYGFLQGTFGLPYGGYCVKPLHLNDIVLNADSPHLSMFCITGKLGEVMDWLEANDHMVANQCTSQDTYTHDIAVEVYTQSSAIARMFKGKTSVDVQLVIRIARTWDRQKEGKKEFRPMLKVIVPSGITLPEVREELARAKPNAVVDATANKALLDVVLSRVSTRDSMLGAGRPRSPAVDGSMALPAYENPSDLPPAYIE